MSNSNGYGIFFHRDPDKVVTPAELRVDPVHFDLADRQHIEVEMRTIVMEMVDHAVTSYTGSVMTDDVRLSHQLQDRALGYQILETKVS